MPSTDATQFAPGMHVTVRDESWLVTAATPAEEGHQRITVRGISPFVRGQVSTFHTLLEERFGHGVELQDPQKVHLVADTSAHYRTTRLFLETTIRNTPASVFDPTLYLVDSMLVDPLPYQRSAVQKALDSRNLRPRLLIADAVGLGKTIEIGLILAELIKRGRGDRILMVVPNHVLEQMQKEMWNRFALPFVRLDTVGIQKVRQKLPATRNPFTYFHRAIISIDTLKQPKYRLQLEKVRWDAVVLDEAHNVTNTHTQNNDLARILSPNTEALILASATPHNGDKASFAELIRLLDPTAVQPNGDIAPEELERLVVRRHRHSPEVDAVVGEEWAQRAEPEIITVQASPEEEAVSRALKEDWLDAPGVRSLQTWTLIKAFLSSPAALESSIRNRVSRLKRAHGSAPEPASAAAQELARLHRLQGITRAITPEHSQKFQALVEYLARIGVGGHSDTRVVIFSERVDTLEWLKTNLLEHPAAEALHLKPKQVATMDGTLADVAQFEIIDRFKRAGDPLRVLITGDVASEGVNLHAQCHHLLHFDIPWSLIRIQQRNGRIDRYGQRHTPRITSLVLDTPPDATPGELRVLTKLVEREHEATRLLGDAQVLMGKHSVKAEEEEIREVLSGKESFEEAVPSAQEMLSGGSLIDDFFGIGAVNPAEEPAGPHPTTPEPAPAQKPTGPQSLYPSETALVDDALMAAFDARQAEAPVKGGVSYRHSGGIFELTPPPDLRQQFAALPQDYLRDVKVLEHFQYLDSPEQGRKQLEEAQSGKSGHTWPLAHFLSPLHPLTQWAADRALASMGKQEVPVVRGTVEGLRVLCLGTWTNSRGQTITRCFTVWDGLYCIPLENPFEWLRNDAGLKPGIHTISLPPGYAERPELTDLVKKAVKSTQALLEEVRIVAQRQATEIAEAWEARKRQWEAHALEAPTLFQQRQVRTRIAHDEELLDQLMPRQSLVRPLVVVVPHSV